MLVPFNLSQLHLSADALICAADKILDLGKLCFLTDLIDANIFAAEGYYLNHDGHDWIVNIPDEVISVFCVALISFCSAYKTPGNFVDFVNNIRLRCLAELA